MQLLDYAKKLWKISGTVPVYKLPNIVLYCVQNIKRLKSTHATHEIYGCTRSCYVTWLHEWCVRFKIQELTRKPSLQILDSVSCLLFLCVSGSAFPTFSFTFSRKTDTSLTPVTLNFDLRPWHVNMDKVNLKPSSRHTKYVGRFEITGRLHVTSGSCLFILFFDHFVCC